MSGKDVPELNAEENRAKRRNENAQILSSILPSVALVIWWQKATGSTAGYSIMVQNVIGLCAIVKRGCWELSAHSSQFLGFCGVHLS